MQKLVVVELRSYQKDARKPRELPELKKDLDAGWQVYSMIGITGTENVSWAIVVLEKRD